MKSFDSHPKSIKKAIRYIKQDATKEQLMEIRTLLDYAINRGIQTLKLDSQEK